MLAFVHFALMQNEPKDQDLRLHADPQSACQLNKRNSFSKRTQTAFCFNASRAVRIPRHYDDGHLPLYEVLRRPCFVGRGTRSVKTGVKTINCLSAASFYRLARKLLTGLPGSAAAKALLIPFVA